jgi:putative PIN family toxin of toxin-antitoxin system
VILDTNLFISYLLAPHGSIKTTIHAALTGEFQLLMPEAILDELGITNVSKLHLRQRVFVKDMIFLFENLHGAAIALPALNEPIPAVTRDPKDDYLIAYALIGEADFLVTGDTDLLDLKSVGKLRILTPADFVATLHLE